VGRIALRTTPGTHRKVQFVVDISTYRAGLRTRLEPVYEYHLFAFNRSEVFEDAKKTGKR